MRKRRNREWILLAVVALCCAAFAGYVYTTRRGADRLAPEIRFSSEELTVSVLAPEKALLAGVTAWDERDGDVTDRVVVESVSSISEQAQVTVTYAAFDQAGNVSKAQRTVRYSDYESPRFTLSQPLVFTSGRAFDVMDYVGAEDAIDGSLDDRVKATLVSEGGSLSEVGLHEVQFRVTNSMGETVYLTAPVEVCASGTYNAALELSDALVYLERGAVFLEEFYLQGMRVGTREISLADGESGVSVQIRSDVDTDVPGTYSVEYTAESGVYTGYTRLLVVVEE